VSKSQRGIEIIGVLNGSSDCKRVLVATFIIAAWPAHAEDAFCAGVPKISTDPNLTLGHISSKATRVHFVKDGSTQPGCPDHPPACTDKAYLVHGDRLILSTRRDAFICATYVNTKRAARIGWLPVDALAYDMAKPIASTDWLGKWSYDEADITVKAGKTGTLLIEGAATYGARNPDRVKRGAVNTGAIEGEATPTGDRLNFTMEFGCKVWMRRLGPWLVVDDDDNCGGINVTFRGIYTRQP
jgi:hypothetical protein